MVKPRRFEVFLVSLDPTVGSEMRKTRPCVVVSPDDANTHLNTLVVVPITSSSRNYPSRVPLRFRNRDGQIAIDQIRAIDGTRLIRKLGRIDPSAATLLAETLRDYFS